MSERHAAEIRLAALLDAAPDAILVADAGGRILLANRRTAELFGWSLDELVGSTVEMLLPERSRRAHVLHRAEYIRDPRTRPMGAFLELYGLRKDGAEFPVEISLSPLQEDGETHVVTIVRDVSDRRALEVESLKIARAQAAQAEAEAAAGRLAFLDEIAEESLLHSSLESLLPAVLERVALSLHADSGVILLGSDGLYDLGASVGLEDGDALVQGVRGVADEVVAERRWVILDERSERNREVLREHGLTSLLGAPLLIGDRTIGTIHAGSRRPGGFGPDDGQLLQLLAARISLAIEHARLYDAAQSAQARLSETIGDLDAIVWESDDPSRAHVTFVSGRAQELLGYPAERWLGEEGFWASILHEDDRTLARLFFEDSGREPGRHEHEYHVVAADGRVVRVRDVVRVARAEDGGVTLRGMLTDVSERRELEARLRQTQKMEAIGQLAGGIAHDFNNLLTVIRGYATRLLRRAEDEATRFELNELGAAADRAAELTGQLLTFSRRAPHSSELIDVNAVAGTLETMLRRLIGEDVDLTFSLAPVVDRIEADRGQLEQLILNLALNARDAMPQGGALRIETRSVDVGADDPVWELTPGRYVLLAVWDTGHGVSPEIRERMFEPFFTTKPPGKGTGLGLATVYGIVEQAGGQILVESEVGHGTRVVVALPSAAPAERKEEEVAEEARATILLVEDEPSLRALARTILAEERYRILEAEDGAAALRLAERHAGPIELVLTDVVMPHLSGPELVEALRAIRPDTRALFMSGYLDSRLASSGIARTQVPLVRKPFDPDDLLARVAEAIAATG